MSIWDNKIIVIVWLREKILEIQISITFQGVLDLKKLKYIIAVSNYLL